MELRELESMNKVFSSLKSTIDILYNLNKFLQARYQFSNTTVYLLYYITVRPIQHQHIKELKKLVISFGVNHDSFNVIINNKKLTELLETHTLVDV
jgi:hypothetical protein